MTQPPEPWPVEHQSDLAELLSEQGMPPEEIPDAAAALASLAAWTAPVPSAADTARLVQQLLPVLPRLPPVRRALRARRQTLWGEWWSLLGPIRAQVHVFRPAFWLSSALVVMFGMLGLSGMEVPSALAMYVSGPLLSYLGAAAAFRGTALGLLEFELACLPSPRQIMLARLVLVLGYDVGLGLVASGLLWLGSGAAPLALTLHWLMPLLLVAGVTLLLSLRLPVLQAATFTYAAWLVSLALRRLWESGAFSVALPASTELLLGGVGATFLIAAVWMLPAATPRLLPHH